MNGGVTEIQVREAWGETCERNTAGLVKRSTFLTVTEFLIDGMEAMATSKARSAAPFSGMLQMLSSNILEIVRPKASEFCVWKGDVAERDPRHQAFLPKQQQDREPPSLAIRRRTR